MTLVRKDPKGIYVITGGYTFRPGPAVGYAHAYRMSAFGIKAGDKVKAAHVGGTPLARIRRPDGRVTFWSSDDATKETITPPPDEMFGATGYRE